MRNDEKTCLLFTSNSPGRAPFLPYSRERFQHTKNVPLLPKNSFMFPMVLMQKKIALNLKNNFFHDLDIRAKVFIKNQTKVVSLNQQLKSFAYFRYIDICVKSSCNKIMSEPNYSRRRAILF